MEGVSAVDARPNAVLQACLVAGTGSVLTLLTIFGLLSDWGSQEVREQVEAALESSPVTGVSPGELMEVARIVLMTIAAFAVAGLVLSVFTARGDRPARIALTVLAALWMPVALVFGVVGILLSVLGAVTLRLLWVPESRQWFAAQSRSDAAPAPTEEQASMSAPPPPASIGYPPYSAPGRQSFGQRPALVPDRRPNGVTAAAVITLVGAGLAALAGLVVGAVFLLAREQFEEGVAGAFPDMTADEQELITSFYGWYFIVCALLALVAIVFAVLLLRDRHRVRVPLVVLSGLTVLLGIVGFPVGLLWSAAAIAVIILLFVGDAGPWFDLRNHRADRERASY